MEASLRGCHESAEIVLHTCEQRYIPRIVGYKRGEDHLKESEIVKTRAWDPGKF
ncbi:MAG: hypothetical protein QCI82_05310 [Candidatus Thermoplasmatota archaeon]|nr:hypothetical protein [Candidatus Thermoplasmatota archaeon]